MSVFASRNGCEAADKCLSDMAHDKRIDNGHGSRPFPRLSRETAEQAAVTRRRRTLSTHAGARTPCTDCAASSTDDVTHAVSFSSRLDRDAARQQASATYTYGPAHAFLGANPPSRPHSTSPATSRSSLTEPRGEVAGWSSDLLSVTRAMVQQEDEHREASASLGRRLRGGVGVPTGHDSPVGRTGQADDPTTGRQLDSSLFVTPYPAALSAAVVVPEAVDPAGSTLDCAALRSSPGLSMSRAPFSLPAADSPSSSSISSQTSHLASPTAPHAHRTDQPPTMSPSRRDTADICPLRLTTDLSSTRQPSPLSGTPAERRSSVHFRDPLVTERASVGGGRGGSKSTEFEGRTAAADAVSADRTMELSPVDKKWGVLFDTGGDATGRFNEVMHSLAKYIIEHLLPAGHVVIVPEKLASFYSISRLDKEAVLYSAMLQTPGKDLYHRLADLYENLGCSYHLVQARLATRPSIPALTPDGFVRWMVLHAQAFPDEEARRLDRLVSLSPLETRSPLDGKPERLPKQLSRHLLPRAPVPAVREQLQQAVKRHFGEAYLAASAAAVVVTAHQHGSRHLSLPPPPPPDRERFPVSRGTAITLTARGRLPPVVHQDRSGSGSGEQEAERRRHRRSPSRTRRLSQANSVSRSTPVLSRRSSPQPSRTRFRTSHADVHHVTEGSSSSHSSADRRHYSYEYIPQSRHTEHVANTRQSRAPQAVETMAGTRANTRKPGRTNVIDSGGRTRGGGGGQISQTWDDFLQRFR